MTIKPRDARRLLILDGWRLKSIRGTHEKWVQPITHRTLIVPGGGSKNNATTHMNTAKQIIQDIIARHGLETRFIKKR